jgi:hypothetical protein
VIDTTGRSPEDAADEIVRYVEDEGFYDRRV